MFNFYNRFLVQNIFHIFVLLILGFNLRLLEENVNVSLTSMG